MGMFDRGARRSRHNQPAQSSSRFRPSIESLECRTLLSVSSVFENGLLTIDVEDVDNVELTVDSGAVLINGAAPTNTNSPGVAVLAADVSEIRVTAVGDFANRISLENVTATDFTSFQSATVDGGGGDDTIFGTQFADSLFGGIGNDVIYGGDGNDLLGGGEGDDQLFGGEGNDQLDGGGQITVTVTNLAPSDGTLLTPVFLATTDGIYDFFDAGAPASTSLERLAEDGTVGPRIDAALASGGVAEALATT
ncbi:MAG: spondin domain-containing protein, partial [Gemmataceae bacterium]